MVGIIVIGVLFLALMELNKNSLWGWALALIVLAGFFFLRRNVLLDKSWLLRAAGWIALVAVLAAVLLFTQGPVLRRPAVEGKDPAATEIVTVEQGQLTGPVSADGTFEVYAGIP